jgi:hypothetical protein
MNSETVGLGEVDSYEFNSRLHQGRDKVNVPREAVELGDNEGSAMKSAKAKCLGDGGAVIALPAFYLDHFLDQ